MNAQFLTPVITVFDENGNLDYEGNMNVYDYLISAGIDGIVLMGSTGEFFNMPMDVKKELIDLAVEHINQRTRLIVGTGGMSLDETIELSNYAYDNGVNEVIIISPYYFTLSPESIENFYNKVAKSIKANIFLYNFPERTGYDLTPEITYNIIRRNKNIVGYKDTVSDVGHTRDLICKISREYPNFDIYSGYDDHFAYNILSGGAGCMGGLSNIVPETTTKWAQAVRASEIVKISKYQKKINNIMEILSIDSSFISTIKKAMVLKKVIKHDKCIEPILDLNIETTEKLKIY